MDDAFDALFQTRPGFEAEGFPGFGDIQAAFCEFARPGVAYDGITTFVQGYRSITDNVSRISYFGSGRLDRLPIDYDTSFGGRI